MDQLVTIFKALSDESRLRILGLLLQAGELCVCDIQSTIGCTQTKVSRHLAYLKKSGLVRDRRKGLWMLYAIATPEKSEHRAIFEAMTHLISRNPKAAEDFARLRDSLNQGCCATVRVIGPGEHPLKLS
jgi:ArsR family transcriptional regulator, arsenate/arsenite/antimonite-responsive transcriptional repressor